MFVPFSGSETLFNSQTARAESALPDTSDINTNGNVFNQQTQRIDLFAESEGDFNKGDEETKGNLNTDKQTETHDDGGSTRTDTVDEKGNRAPTETHGAPSASQEKQTDHMEAMNASLTKPVADNGWGPSRRGNGAKGNGESIANSNIGSSASTLNSSSLVSRPSSATSRTRARRGSVFTGGNAVAISVSRADAANGSSTDVAVASATAPATTPTLAPRKNLLRQLSASSEEAWGAVSKIAAHQDSTITKRSTNNDDSIPLQQTSLWIFAPTNRYRLFAWRVSRSAPFNYIVLTLVTLATLLLCTAPTDVEPDHQLPGSCTNETCPFVWTQLIVGIAFTIEAGIKVVARGVISEPGAYLRSGHTNRLDAVVVLFFWIELIVEHVGGTKWVSLSAFRALRVLAVAPRIKAFSQIKDIFKALSGSASLLINVIGVLLFGLLIFGVLGVESFKESLSRQCVRTADGSFARMLPRKGCKTLQECPNGFECIVGLSPGNGFVSFDHMGFAFVALFQVVTYDDWPNQIMLALKESEPDYAKGLWIYFAGLCILVVFLALNLFVAVLVSNFARVRAMRVKDSDGDNIASSSSMNDNRQGVFSRLSRAFCSCFRKSSAHTSAADVEDRCIWMHGSRLSVVAFLKSRVWKWIVAIAIVLNTIALTLEHEGQSDRWSWSLLITEWVFNAFFLIEVTLRIAAMGLKDFFHDGENQFDFLLVVPPIVIQVVLMAMGEDGFATRFSAVRAFRVLRLLVHIPKLWSLVETLLRSKWGMVNLILFYIVTATALSILGMQLFGDVPEETERNRITTFETYGSAMLSIFHIATGHGWAEIQYRYMAVGANNAFDWSGDTFSTIAAIYFVSVFVSCNFVFINLFIAVILENYALRDKEMDKILSRTLTIMTPTSRRQSTFHRDCHIADGRKEHDCEGTPLSSTTPVNGNEKAAPNELAIRYSERSDVTQFRGSKDTASGDDVATKGSGCWYQYRSLFATMEVKYRRQFDNFIYIIIIFSSVLLALIGPPHTQSPVINTSTMNGLDAVIGFFFLCEFVVRLAWEGGNYFRSGWNCLDFTILVITIIDLGFVWSSSGVSLDFARVFRLMRCLRPLRVLNRNQSMKIIVNGLISAFKSLGYVLLLFAVFTFLFAIMGNQLYSGKLVQCNHQVPEKVQCVGTSLQAAHPDFPMGPHFIVPRAWTLVHPSANFDTVAWSALTLFRAATLEWTDTLAALTSVVGPDLQPEFRASPFQAWFLMFFMFLSTLLVINLFVAVVVEYFKASASHTLVTLPQKQWVSTVRLLRSSRIHLLEHPRQTYRRLLYRLCMHIWFERFVTVTIAANGAFLMMQHQGESEAWSHVLKVANYVFLVWFTVELVIKVLALGVKRYIRDNWNKMDCFIVLGSWVALGVETKIPFVGKLSRMLRVMRLMRLVAIVPTLYMLAETMWASLPSIANIFGLILMMFWMFSVLGVMLFGDVKLGFRIGKVAHFGGFFQTMLSLFQIITGDDWDALMEDCLRARMQHCTSSDTEGIEFGDCGPHPAATIAFFVVYMTIALYVCANLFTAVVIENFSHFSEHVPALIEYGDVEQFKASWRTLDTELNGKIPVGRLRALMDMLGDPLVETRPKLARTFYLAVRSDLMRSEHKRRMMVQAKERKRLQGTFQERVRGQFGHLFDDGEHNDDDLYANEVTDGIVTQVASNGSDGGAPRQRRLSKRQQRNSLTVDKSHLSGVDKMLAVRSVLPPIEDFGDFEVGAVTVMKTLLNWSTADVCFSKSEGKQRSKLRDTLRPWVSLEIVSAWVQGYFSRRRNPQFKKFKDQFFRMQATVAAARPIIVRRLPELQDETRLRAGHESIASFWNGGSMEASRLRARRRGSMVTPVSVDSGTLPSLIPVARYVANGDGEGNCAQFSDVSTVYAANVNTENNDGIDNGNVSNGKDGIKPLEGEYGVRPWDYGSDFPPSSAMFMQPSLMHTAAVEFYRPHSEWQQPPLHDEDSHDGINAAVVMPMIRVRVRPSTSPDGSVVDQDIRVFPTSHSGLSAAMAAQRRWQRSRPPENETSHQDAKLETLRSAAHIAVELLEQASSMPSLQRTESDRSVVAPPAVVVDIEKLWGEDDDDPSGVVDCGPVVSDVEGHGYGGIDLNGLSALPDIDTATAASAAAASARSRVHVPTSHATSTPARSPAALPGGVDSDILSERRGGRANAGPSALLTTFGGPISPLFDPKTGRTPVHARLALL